MSPKSFIQTTITGLALLGGLAWPLTGAATLTIPDTPLFLNSTGVAPNIVMTFDDSGSMRRGWAPESVSSDQTLIDGPRFKSPSVNGLYYNPRVTYNIPTRSDGTTYTTSFANARFNGFDSSKGTVNLSTSYKVVGQSEPTHAYSACPCYNTMTCSTYLTTANSSGTCRLVRHPGSVTTTTHTATCTDVFFNDRGFRRGNPRNDEIEIQGTGTGCSTFFQGIPDGTTVTVTGAGSYNGTYTVTSQEDDRTIRIQNAFTQDSSENPGPTATLTWLSTSSSGGNTAPMAAYYYLYYQDKPGTAQPAACTTPNRANDNCYVKSVVGSAAAADRDIAAGTQAQQQQNFANWYSFYRTRSLAVMSGAMSAVTGLDNGTVRLGWQTINQCTTFGTGCQGYDNVNRENRLRALSSSYKTNFYNWLQRFEVSGNTPLRSAMTRAGTYFTTSGQNSPYAEDPYVTQGTERACRKNFHVMFTDGLWNSDSGYATPGGSNPDSSGTTTLPDGEVYTPMTPYKDVNVATSTSYTNTNSISDTAFYYWATDLRSTLSNEVPAYVTDRSGTSDFQYWNPKNDPASWQHMVNYTIGLGLSASLVPECYYNPDTDPPTADPNNPDPGCPTWGGNTYAGDYADLLAGTLNWPRIYTPTSSNLTAPLNAEPDGHVYELWHAALNSRGKFYSADDPADLVTAFREVMDTISSIAAAGGGAGLRANTTQINQEGATVFEAKFNADWSGLVLARPVNLDGSLGTEYWDAGLLIPNAATRNIFTLNDGAAQAFSSCAGSLATELNRDANGTVDNLCPQRLAWLRGFNAITGASWSSGTNTVTFTVPNHGFAIGNSAEVTDVTPSAYNGTYTVTAVTTGTFSATLSGNPGTYASGGKVRYSGFRDRLTSVLGDIMNSDPYYTYKEDLGYGGASVTLAGHSTYAAFVTSKSSRVPVLYQGANDGMLHAFQADIGQANSGKELFAYIPGGVYGNLSKLTDPGYAHKYYVDGSPMVGDAFIGGNWATYLVSGLGAGGKSVFALDVSNPVAFSASNVKWEFTDATDLGLTYSQPQIAPTTSSQWAAIFGNGYNSSSDRAYLYVVDLSNGSQIAKIATNSSIANGLSIPYLHDSDGDKIADIVYAGDLQGNLWKFVNTSGSWTLGNGSAPLFTARNASNEVQPITSQPKVAAHPNGGVLVYFGTGSYLTNADLTNDDAQSFYAIWDKSGATGTVARAALQPQTILNTLDAFGHTVRTTSNNGVDWSSQRGWYLDLPATLGSPSERIFSTPLVMEFTSVPDRILFVTTIPSSDPCGRSGTGWLMELDLYTGARTSVPIFDVNSDSKFNESDVVESVDENGDGDTDDPGDKRGASGVQFRSDFGIVAEPPLNLEKYDDDGSCMYLKLVSGTSGVSGPSPGTSNPCEPKVPGSGAPPVRIYWQQIL